MSKNNGFTLVEMVMTMFLFVITSYFLITSYTYQINKQKIYNVKNRIIVL